MGDSNPELEHEEPCHSRSLKHEMGVVVVGFLFSSLPITDCDSLIEGSLERSFTVR